MFSTLPDFYLVDVQFRPTSIKLYTYRVPTTWGLLKVGDQIVVPSPFDAFSIVTIKNVMHRRNHPTGHYNHKWAASKVDMSDFNRIQEMMAFNDMQARIRKQIEETHRAARIAALKKIVDNDPFVSRRARDLMDALVRELAL